MDRYQAIVEAADIAGIGLGIFVNRGGVPTILDVNDAALRICARTLEEVKGQPVLQFLAPDSWPMIEELWQGFLLGYHVQHSSEITLLHKDGHPIPASIGLSRMVIDNEASIIAFLTDISEQKRTEEALVLAKAEAEEISRMKSNILSNFSHELRTPLHAILGFSALLADAIEDEELREYAASIQRSGERLLSTVTSIVEIAAIESSPTAITLYPMLLSEVLEGEALALKPITEDRGIELILDIRERNQIVLFDKDRFHKAFEKIANNAVKFTQSGSIHITLSEEIRTMPYGRQEARAVIRMRDTGIGMPPEFLQTAFEKFKQESSGFSRTYEGTGLGLPLARSYIKLMNGDIELTSKLGEGTEVILSFPIVGKI
jgi:PAS domain S-box-containing protein